MTKEEFINFLEEHDIHYTEYTDNGLDQVYVLSREEYEKKKKNPRKYKYLYVPYIRVSHFDEPTWYTRENGWTQYMEVNKVLDKAIEIGA